MRTRRPLAALVGTLIAAGLVTMPASATTGASTGLPEPGVKVALEDGSPFEGRYVLEEIDPAARITAGQINVYYTQTQNPYLVGFAEFDSYDNDGRRSLWTANLWPFRFKRPVLSADVRSQGSNSVLGKLALRPPTRPGRFPADLTVDGKTFHAVFKPIPEETSLAGNMPPARLTRSRSRAAKLTKTGWGAEASYFGRYSMVHDPTTSGASAATYAPLVMLARGLANLAPTPLTAGLTMFSFQAQKRDIPAPAGIFKLHTAGSTDLLFLTDLKSGGAERTGVLRGGNFNGPILGRFDATKVGDHLEGAAVIRGQQINLVLRRFSEDPKP